MGLRSKYKEGDTVTAPNGYKYVYVIRDGKLTRVLMHHHLAFKKYGRWPRDNERVVFKDGNRRNLTQANVEFRPLGNQTENALLRRQKNILNRIADLQGEYAEVTQQLKELREEAGGQRDGDRQSRIDG